MEISSRLHRFADSKIPHKQQTIIKAFAKALEIIPRQLCDNAGFDATDILNRLRVEHRKGHIWAGVDFDNYNNNNEVGSGGGDGGVSSNNLDRFVWEPSLVKINAIQAATEASCLILSVDETISTFYWILLPFYSPPPTKPNTSYFLRTFLLLANAAAEFTSKYGMTD